MKNIIRISLIAVALMLAAALVGCGQDAAVTTVDAGGEGQYSFEFTAVFADGTKETHSVVTECETVGEALIEKGLISGEDGPYGLMVSTVCGVVADYGTDKTYWALYVGGEYSMVGVDALKCADVTEVEFRVEK